MADFLRSKEDEALAALEKLNRRIDAVKAAGFAPAQSLLDEQKRLGAIVAGEMEEGDAA